MDEKLNEMIEAIKNYCAQNDYVLMLFASSKRDNDRHVAAYGSGIEVRDLIASAMNDNVAVSKVIQEAVKKQV